MIKGTVGGGIDSCRKCTLSPLFPTAKSLIDVGRCNILGCPVGSAGIKGDRISGLVITPRNTPFISRL